MELLNEISSTLSSPSISLWLKSLVIIECFVALYMLVVLLQIMSKNTVIKLLFVSCAVFILGITQVYDTGVNIKEILSELKYYPIGSFLLGFILTAIMMIALITNHSLFLSPALLFISVLFVIIAFDSSLISWTSEIAVYGTAGKLI